LLTLYCFARASESAHSARWLAAMIGACLLGMATKETMATAPLVVLLYDRTFVPGTFREAPRAGGGTGGNGRVHEPRDAMELRPHAVSSDRALRAARAVAGAPGLRLRHG